MARLAELENLGPVSEQRLLEVGIRGPDDLAEVGAVAAYRRVKAAYPRNTSLVLLHAFQGALWDLHWNALPPDVKATLRAEARAREEPR